ncbi:MAG: DMT family transporter [Rhodobacteraceae bacterium]|nr:DMT family transporter [Paracoccaceae bacterium]
MSRRIIPQGVTGGLFSLAAFGSYATHDALVKFLGGAYPVFQIIFFGSLFGFPWLFLLMYRQGSFSLRPRHPWWVASRTIASLITGVTVFYAFTRLPLAEVYAIIFATPLVITAMSIPILGEAVGWRRWSAIAAGLIGVLIVLRPGVSPLTLAHLAALAAVFSGGFVSITLRKISHDERNTVLMFYPLLINFSAMALILPMVWVPMTPGHLAINAGMAGLGFLAMVCLYAAYRRAPVSVVAPMQYSQILWASLYGAMFFGEIPSLRVAFGAGIIILSGGFVLWRESRG